MKMKGNLKERTEKYCKKCDTVKSSEEFHKKTKNYDGLQSCCKVCQNDKTKGYRESHRDYWKGIGVYSVYSISAPDGMKYAGSTETSVKLRFQRHKANYLNNKVNFQPLLYASFDKHGFDNHKVEQLATNLTKKSARILEGELIKLYKHMGIALNKHNIIE